MQYKVKDPQGNIRVIQGPDGASDDEVIAQAQKLFTSSTTPSVQPPIQQPQQSSTPAQPQESSMMDVMKAGGLPVLGEAAKILPQYRALQEVPGLLGGAASQLKAGLYDIPKDIATLPSEIAQGKSPADTSLGQFTQQGTEGLSQGIQQTAAHPLDTLNAHPLSAALMATGFMDNDAISAIKSGASDIYNKLAGTLAEKPSAIEISNAEAGVSKAIQKAKTMADNKLNSVKEQFSTSPNFDDVSDVGEPKPSLKDLKNRFLEYFNSRAPKMEEAGMTPPEFVDKPKIEVYNKGSMGGGISPNTGKPLPKVNVWGVKGDPAEISKLGFGEDPGSVPEEVLKQHGLLPDVSGPPGPQFASPKEEIGSLINMRQGLQDEIRPKISDQAGNVLKAVGTTEEAKVRGMISKINDRIAELPGGDSIRDAEKHWSTAKSTFDDLQSKMSQPGKASQFLQRLFKNPSGSNGDYLNKLATVQEMSREPVLDKLFELYKKGNQGLSYEELKHPLANAIKKGLPQIGVGIRSIGRGGIQAGIPAAGVAGLQTPFNTPDMQSLKDRLRANK